MPRRPSPPRPTEVALAATLHDARGALREDVERFLPRLQALYRSIVVATSPPTDRRLTALLAAPARHAGTPAATPLGGEWVTRSRAGGEAICGGGAAPVVQRGRDVAYLECRGLDWETPDRHRRSVRRVGLPAWRNRWSSPAEWDLRIDMASEILRGAMRALAGAPRARPIRRLPRRVG